ncbi:PadR family transcriptional regulator [Actinacidiphila sp. bgisy145]|uniref:PadR family transcriptional regulator n=1 Tax=Actinacidiphila sp. bgisy145 TaxID=3413792 RepID=UPI003EB86462
MSLRHALLGLLDSGPRTGYELARLFDASAHRVWHATHPQVYTELRKMEADGLVTAEEQPRGGPEARAVKRAYGLTGAGRDELAAWVGAPEEPPALRDSGLLRTTYLEYTDPEGARRHFRLHRDHYARMGEYWRQEARRLERHESDLLRARLDQAPPGRHQAIVRYKVHVYQGLAERADAEIAWAEKGLALVDELGDESVEFGSPTGEGASL